MWTEGGADAAHGVAELREERGRAPDGAHKGDRGECEGDGGDGRVDAELPHRLRVAAVEAGVVDLAQELEQRE